MSPTAVILWLTAANAEVRIKMLERESVEAIDKMKRSAVPTDKHWPPPITKEEK